MKPNIARSTQAHLEQVTQSVVNIPVKATKKGTHFSKPFVKSPLRYPGGKSRAVNQILDLLPLDSDTLCSPFIGGGSVELACASRAMRVYGYDAFEPLVNFWQVALDDSAELAKRVSDYYPLSRTKFYALQKQYFESKDRCRMAAVFYALNRSSFSGTTLSGGMSPGHPRFTQSAIERLASLDVDNLTVQVADFQDSISKHKNDFLYLDPPYANGGKLYGKRGNMHEGFNHEALAHLLHQRDGWVLSYNDCNTVRDLYKGYRFIAPKWTYGMNNSKKSNEVLILSHD